MDWPTLASAITLNHPAFPEPDLRALIANPGEAAPRLLEVLLEHAAHPEALVDRPDYVLHLRAMVLLAAFREARALAPVLALVSRPSAYVDDILGDFLTEYLDKVLASLSGDDAAPIMRLVENPEADFWVRAVALDALAILAIEGALPRPELVAYLRRLMRQRLTGPEPEDDFLTSLIHTACDIHPGDLEEEIAEAFQAGRVDLQMLGPADVARAGRQPVEVALAANRARGKKFIDDPLACLRDLHAWAHPSERTAWNDFDQDRFPTHPFVRDEPKIGRNDPCPCGSGRKYKKCCLT